MSEVGVQHEAEVIANFGKTGFMELNIAFDPNEIGCGPIPFGY